MDAAPQSRGSSGAGDRRRWQLAAVLAASLNLRIAIVVVGPVIEVIRGDLHLSSTEAGVLAMIPFLCMSGFSLAGPRLLDNHGAARGVVLGLILITVGTAVRSVMPTAFLLLLMTVPIGVGLGFASVSLPAVVKDEFPEMPGRVTGWYVGVMALGAAIAGYAIVPLSEALGGWREAFAATSLVGLVALPLWLRRGNRAPERSEARSLRRPTGMDIRLGLIFAGVSFGFTGTLTWASAIYLDNGWSAHAAGAVTGAIMLISVPAALLLPGMSDGRNRPFWTAVAGLIMGAGILAMALVPTVAPALWVIVFGIGNGASFPLVLTLPLDTGATAQAVAPMVAWAMGIGFFFGSISPVIVGALRDLSGGFELPMTLLALMTAAGCLLALTVRRAPVTSRA